MADVVRERTSASRKAEIGGVIINTCGWVRGEGYNQIKHIAQVSTRSVLTLFRGLFISQMNKPTLGTKLTFIH